MSEATVFKKVRVRIPHLISKKHVRRYLLDRAKATRAHKFTRVSRKTLDDRGICDQIVKSQPSKGETL